MVLPMTPSVSYRLYSSDYEYKTIIAKRSERNAMDVLRRVLLTIVQLISTILFYIEKVPGVVRMK